MTSSMTLRPMAMMMLKRTNTQYSLRRARPSNTAYFLRTSRYQLIVSPSHRCSSSDITSALLMTDGIRQKWTDFKAAKPGERFEQWYERGHTHTGSPARKILLMGGGFVLIFVGVVLLAIPGPGIPVGFVGAGLLAA